MQVQVPPAGAPNSIHVLILTRAWIVLNKCKYNFKKPQNSLSLILSQSGTRGAEDLESVPATLETASPQPDLFNLNKL